MSDSSAGLGDRVCVCMSVCEGGCDLLRVDQIPDHYSLSLFHISSTFLVEGRDFSPKRLSQLSRAFLLSRRL